MKYHFYFKNCKVFSHLTKGLKPLKLICLIVLIQIISLSSFAKNEVQLLDNLVKIANMSKGNLIRVFKNATGQTPIEYLIDIRIQHATELLSKSNLPVNEIAFQLGFSDGNYFSRHFTKKLKYTPSEYRILNKKSK